MPKEPTPSRIKSFKLSYFEDGEALKERSIQEVCELPEVKPDAKRANFK